MSFVLFHAADLPPPGSRSPPSLVSAACPPPGGEPLLPPQLRRRIGHRLAGGHPLPAKAVQRLQDTSAGSAVLSVAEPVALVLLLVVCTAYLVDGSFNPFLYFRF